MDDIQNVQTDATKVAKKKKRSTLYTVLASILLVLLVGVMAGAGWWVYDTYMTTPNESNTETVSSASTKSAEEKELDTISKDVDKDASLSTDDLDNDVNDINSVDVSGI